MTTYNVSQFFSDAPAAGPGGGPTFLPPARHVDLDATYIYCGWPEIGNQWRVRRQNRGGTSTTQDATPTQNLNMDFDAAWGARAMLNYGTTS